MKYLKKLKDEIVTKYKKKMNIESATEEQKKEYEDAKEDLKAKEKSLVKPNKSFLFRLFRRRLYLKQVADYNKTQEEIDAAKKRVSSAGLVVEQKETKIQELQAKMEEELKLFEGMDLEISRNAAIKQPALLDNEEYKKSCKKIREYIDEMIKVDPNLVSDVEFMKDCVEFDMSLITLDKTNDDAVYEEYLKQHKEYALNEAKLLSEGYTRAEIDRVYENYAQLFNEVTKPAYVSDGKFKIPHKYIFERIRGVAALDPKKSGISDVCEFAYAEYKKYDGKMEKSQGEQLMSLYEDSDNYLYMHSVNYKGDVPADKQAEVVEKISSEGLLIPSENDLAHTTLNTRESADKLSGFFNFLPYWNGDSSIIVAQIPKSEIDGNAPIIGYQSVDSRGYLLPKYIKGHAKSGTYVSNKYHTDPSLSGSVVKYAILASDGKKPTASAALVSD